MRSLTGMTPDELQEAYRAADTLLRFRVYLPPGGLLVMLAGKFRDDVRDVLEMEPQPPAYRGRDRRSLDELTSAELDTVAGATSILLDRFARYMDDPALVPLLRELRDSLDVQKSERARLWAEIGTK
jgi:hypothetical protein